MLIRAMKQRDWDRNIKIGSFERVWSGVQLGSLKGNRFSIALRFIDKNVSDKDLRKNV
jgi:tRNA(Glu) U13 pseudouridine synthase TruD